MWPSKLEPFLFEVTMSRTRVLATVVLTVPWWKRRLTLFKSIDVYLWICIINMWSTCDLMISDDSALRLFAKQIALVTPLNHAQAGHNFKITKQTWTAAQDLRRTGWDLCSRQNFHPTLRPSAQKSPLPEGRLKSDWQLRLVKCIGATLAGSVFPGRWWFMVVVVGGNVRITL